MQAGLRLPSRLGLAALTERQLIEMAVLADATPGWDSSAHPRGVSTGQQPDLRWRP